MLTLQKSRGGKSSPRGGGKGPPQTESFQNEGGGEGVRI